MTYLWQELKDWRQRRVRREIDRIRGGFSETFYVPNTPAPLFIRMRILEYFGQWWRDMSPRTPEQVAWATYQMEIA